MEHEKLKTPSVAVERIQDEDLESSPEEPRTTRVLKARMAHARKVLRGECMFGDTIREDLEQSIAASEEGEVSAEPLLSDAKELLVKLPYAEISNVLSRADNLLASGESGSAKSWHADAITRLRHWESAGVLTSVEMEYFRSRIYALMPKLYGEEEAMSENSDYSSPDTEPPDDVVRDFEEFRMWRESFPKTPEEVVALERVKETLILETRTIFTELKERSLSQWEEIVLHRKRMDQRLGVQTIHSPARYLENLPWDSLEDRALAMIRSAVSISDVELSRIYLTDLTTRIRDSQRTLEKTLIQVRALGF